MAANQTATVHLNIAGIPLAVEYLSCTEKFATIASVTPEGGLDNIIKLLAPDVINSIRVACVKHAREEAAFLRRVLEQEEMEA